MFSQIDGIDAEVILVDNGSTDRTLIIAGKYPLNLYVCHGKGAGAARNLGLLHAQGEVIAFLDGDVEIQAGWVETVLETLKGPLWDVVQGPNRPVGIDGKFMTRMRKILIGHITRGSFNYLTLASKGLPHLNTAAVAVKARFFREGKVKFDENFRRCEDTDLTLQLLFVGAHMKEISTLESRVSDDRGPLTYLVRMYQTSRYRSLISRKWKNSTYKGKVFHIKTSSFFLRFYFLLMKIFWKAGELFSPAEVPTDSLPALLRISRNSFYFSANGWELSSKVRMISLENQLVLLPLPWGERLILEGDERLSFLAALLQKSVIDNPHLLEKLKASAILVSSGSRE